MSDRPDHADRDEESVRAGEYVLGLLEPDEAARLEDEAGRRPALARAVGEWERRLAPLLRLVPAANPPPSLWTRVEASAFGRVVPHGPDAAPSRSAGRPADGRRRGRGRMLGAGVVGFALAASIAAAVVFGGPRPAIAPLAVPVAVPVAALLPKAPGEPTLLASRLPDGALAIRPIGALATPAGHAYELWSLPAGAARPAPLGLLPDGGVVLPAARVPAGPGAILVSLEPDGGSPTGLPTGPVLWGGAWSGTAG